MLQIQAQKAANAQQQAAQAQQLLLRSRSQQAAAHAAAAATAVRATAATAAAAAISGLGQLSAEKSPLGAPLSGLSAPVGSQIPAGFNPQAVPIRPAPGGMIRPPPGMFPPSVGMPMHPGMFAAGQHGMANGRLPGVGTRLPGLTGGFGQQQLNLNGAPALQGISYPPGASRRKR